jgi:hypothetical protein
MQQINTKEHKVSEPIKTIQVISEFGISRTTLWRKVRSGVIKQFTLEKEGRPYYDRIQILETFKERFHG